MTLIPWEVILPAYDIEYKDHDLPATKHTDPKLILLHHQVGYDPLGYDNALAFVVTGPIAPYYNAWINTGENLEGQGEGYVNAITRQKANHAGRCDYEHIRRAAAGVRVEDRPDLPRLEVINGHPDWININDETIGVCLEGPPFSDVQIASAIRVMAATCDYYDFDPHVVILSHEEAAAPRGRKSDPEDIHMDWVRDVVASVMNTGGDMAVMPDNVQQFYVDQFARHQTATHPNSNNPGKISKLSTSSMTEFAEANRFFFAALGIDLRNDAKVTEVGKKLKALIDNV
ncbi:MAG: N-acetylmuramoyl-L-alanine amidase [Nitrosopumilus sp.]